MLKRHKDLMRTIVAELRRTLAGTTGQDDEWQRGDLDRELERLGIAVDGTITPIDALPNPTPAERWARRVADAQLGPLPLGERAAARSDLVERAAYSWINRLLALRAMEARGLIAETLRNNPDYDGISEALYILRHGNPSRAAGADGGWWAVVEGACTEQAKSLPGLFDQNDPATALRPSTAALLHCVATVGGAPTGYRLGEVDAAFADPDAIGWAYQFYQEEAKARTYAKLGSGGKASTRAEIAAVTQLFTEPYMVQWLLQNSLGRSYHEAYPDSKLPEGWAYYVQRDDVTTSDSATSDSGTADTSATLDTLTVMDPCVGSGHFLREAFDMLVAMYREQYPEMSAASIADRILSHHLHGIDLDPRAAQLVALTLYLRAWELVRDEHQRQRKRGPISYRPPRMNFATTPTGLRAGALDRYLSRHPEDRIFKPLLQGVFAALEQADILGSLLHPGAQLTEAIAALQKPHTIRMDFDADVATLRRTVTEMAAHDPEELKRLLLDRIAASFAAESDQTDDVSAALFGREAERGVRLLQLLDRQYAVVVTNPPYMGSKNMDAPLKRFVERHYSAGKRDLYAAFILRCLDFCRHGGRVAMVTQQSWMFLRSFVDLRAILDEKLADARKKGHYTGLLRETSIELLAHLGPNSFEEISGEVVQNAMFTLAKHVPDAEHRIVAFRLVGVKSAQDKASILSRLKAAGLQNVMSAPRQVDFLPIPETPLVYWLRPRFFELLRSERRLRDVAEVRQGLATADNERYTRCFWEVPGLGVVRDGRAVHGRWFWYAKGGRYQKWAGLEWLVVDWEYEGRRIKGFVGSDGRIASRPQNDAFYFQTGVTYSPMGRGSMGARSLKDSVFDVKGASIFVSAPEHSRAALAGVLSSHLTSFILRVTTQYGELHVGYVANVPLPDRSSATLASTGSSCVTLKRLLVAQDPVERTFAVMSLDAAGSSGYSPNGKRIETKAQAYAALLHTLEGLNEQLVCDAHELVNNDVQAVVGETGTPAGWYPLIANYDKVPELPATLNVPPLPQVVHDYLTKHVRIQPDAQELARVKAHLRALYEAGPGAKEVELEGSNELTASDDEEEVVSGGYLPIPTETFLEELSVKMQIHPISVFWLIEELRAEGARCKPEEQRLLDDRLSVLVLRLLGHRWPKQLEAGEPIPEWADRDGIIPLTTGTSEPTLAERLRERLRVEDGELGAQRTEGLLAELTGQNLDEWLRRTYFPRHVRQFKYRPIAWHLASRPQGSTGKRRGGVRRAPTFECLLYYHACGGDVLARIRTQYVEPLVRIERRRAEEARNVNDETAATIALDRMQELEDFARRLRTVEEEGFACRELDAILEHEPLDRWSGDGLLSPSSRDELRHNERAWHVDINDGVRVNIAPLQLAGVLVSDVLKSADAQKAIADRARWRADERRWVREGNLPRCGWMDDSVPESPRWTELAPQRAAEQARLEEKRKAVLTRLGDAVERSESATHA